MELYHYHPVTGELGGTSEARLDIRESKRQEKECYLLPANATSLAPPKKQADKVRVFKRGKWSQVVDLRGTPYWLDGDELVMQDPGPLPEGALTEAPPPTPEQELEIEMGWVRLELGRADIELNKVLDGHTRKRGTEPTWRQYRNSLRDYIQDGSVTGSRPGAPDA